MIGIASALLSGGVQALLPTLPGQDVVALVVLVPLLRALDGAGTRACLLLAVAYATALGEVAIVPWLAPALATYFALPETHALAYAAALVAVLAVVHGLALGTVLALRPRRCGAWRVLWYGALWAAWEALRSYVPPGFPAAVLGASLGDAPALLQLASVTGVAGITAAVVAANAGVAALLDRTAPRAARLRASTTGLAIVALATLWGERRLASPVDTPADAPVVVAVDVGAHDAAQSTLERLIAATPPPAGRRDLVVWPESAITSDLARDRAAWRRLTDFVTQTGATLAAGGMTLVLEPDGGTTRFNSLHVIRPRFAIESYHKRLLVPLAEAWPALLGAPPASLEPVAAGRELPLIAAGDTRFGPSICFEIADAASVRSLARAGARFVANVTNDAFFAAAAAPHLAWARLRAIESGLPVVRVANAGVSAVFDPLGRMVASSGPAAGRPTVLEAAVPAGRATPYVATGDVFLLACLTMVLIGAVGSGRMRACRQRAAVAEAVLGRAR